MMDEDEDEDEDEDDNDNDNDDDILRVTASVKVAGYLACLAHCMVAPTRLMQSYSSMYSRMISPSKFQTMGVGETRKTLRNVQ